MTSKSSNLCCIVIILCLALSGCVSQEKNKPLSPRFNHVFLNVADMDRSIKFYTSAFDLEVYKHVKSIKRTVLDGESTEGEVNLALLRFPGQKFNLEIGENQAFTSENNKANYAHLGIDVEDIVAASKRVEEAGGVLLRPITLVEADDITAKIVFYSGPDGETIELLQLISGDF